MGWGDEKTKQVKFNPCKRPPECQASGRGMCWFHFLMVQEAQIISSRQSIIHAYKSGKMRVKVTETDTA